MEIVEKTLPPQLIASIRMRGKYSDCGRAFSKLGRRFGRHMCGKPFLLIYDTEYKANDADFEACFPIRKGETSDEISVREISGGKCLSLMHHGPYEQLGPSYDKILGHARERGLEIELPTREIYVKGPGMIFRGNPKKYVTEIQMLIKPA